MKNEINNNQVPCITIQPLWSTPYTGFVVDSALLKLYTQVWIQISIVIIKIKKLTTSQLQAYSVAYFLLMVKYCSTIYKIDLFGNTMFEYTLEFVSFLSIVRVNFNS